MSQHLIRLGKEPFEDRSGEERTVDRRGRQFGPRMPLVPSLPRAFPWGGGGGESFPRAQDCRTLTKKPGWAERGLHSIARGWGGGPRGEDSFWLSSPAAGGWSWFWHGLLGLPGGGRRKRRRS